MTPAQEGAYWRLLAYAWLDPECSIPADQSILAHLSRMGDDWVKGGYELVMSCFKPHPTITGRLVNERLLKEREKQYEWRVKSSVGGQRSAQKRWGPTTKDTSRVVTKCLPNGGNQSVTLQSPVSCLHTAVHIYEQYPLKVGKPRAISAITKALKKIDPETLFNRTKQYAEVRNGDLKFVPHPATWFNQERYNDDPSTWKPSENTSGHPAQHVDRSIGTANEGTADLYKGLGSLVRPERVRRPST